MRKESLEFLQTLQQTPSPSGFEQPIQRIVRKRMKPFADTIETDVHGNVIVGINPKGNPRVMLSGHCDQIGLMVKHIDDRGYLYFASIGGIDPSVLPGTRVVVHSQHGPIDGVIGRKPVHVMKPEERGGKVELQSLWIDIGAVDKKEVQKVIRIGDPVTFTLDMVHLGQDFVTSPAFDNKCGLFVVMEALRLCSIKKLRCALFAVSTVQEEIGLRGARTSCYGIDPTVGIAVDVAHATDYPDMDKRTNGDLKLGGGPVIVRGANVNPKLEAMLAETARKKRIGVQWEGTPGGTPTDANVMQVTRQGVATSLVSVANRYMHTQVEVVSLSDLEKTARLIADTVAQIHARSNFIPD
ncbi:MAG: M42 family metallopeptidase [Planctomycetota bacterium]